MVLMVQLYTSKGLLGGKGVVIVIAVAIEKKRINVSRYRHLNNKLLDKKCFQQQNNTHNVQMTAPLKFYILQSDNVCTHIIW